MSGRTRRRLGYVLIATVALIMLVGICASIGVGPGLFAVFVGIVLGWLLIVGLNLVFDEP